MSLSDLRKAQLYFESQIGSVLQSRQQSYNVRDNFVKYFNTQRLQSMSLEQFAIGNGQADVGYNFCYTLERSLDKLGRTTGATSSKFGVYYGKTRSDKRKKYRHTKKFGSDLDSAFINVKLAIIELLKAGKAEDINVIEKNILSPMFKGKILCTYFPNNYLNIFSNNHLDYFLVQLNLDTRILLHSNEVSKRKVLADFKESDPVMRHWTLDVFQYFLYNVYPGRPGSDRKDPKNNFLDEYRIPSFPISAEPEWINLNILPPNHLKETINNKKFDSNPDYEKEQKKQRQYGDRGEKIVIDMEKKRLEQLNRHDLAKSVEKEKYDYVGYDILSREENGDYRYIEVKTTSAKIGPANFFLTANELTKALELRNYYLYIVYDILSTKPKIWILSNPFNPKNTDTIMLPALYRIKINASK